MFELAVHGCIADCAMAPWLSRTLRGILVVRRCGCDSKDDFESFQAALIFARSSSGTAATATERPEAWTRPLRLWADNDVHLQQGTC
mmetsp:Transcript_26420/g.87612  ORF Transcript_26420/g.87612 Transcript_26420/m.87612 type:complete len:87 (-) Transcript_26420:218-478(-)